MKLNKLFLVCACGMLSAAGLHGAMDIRDTATYYDENNWYAFRSGTMPQMESQGDSLVFSKLDPTSSYVLCYLSRVQLEVGDTYSVSGILRLSEADPDGTFAFGLFDSVNNPESDIPAHTNKGSPANFTSSMSGILTTTSSLIYRPQNSTQGFLSVASGGGRVNRDFVSGLAHPESGRDYAFSMLLEKTAIGFDVEVALGMGAAYLTENVTSFSVESDTLSCFDVLGFRFSAATGSETVLSDLRFETTGTVIPEPSMFAFSAGILGSLAFGLRRRRVSRTPQAPIHS